MDATRDIKQEIANWERKTGFLPELEGIPFQVACTWAEVFKMPFKLKSARIWTFLANDYTSGKLRYKTHIRIRPEYEKDVERIKQECGYYDQYLTSEIDAKASFWKTFGNWAKSFVTDWNWKNDRVEVWKEIPYLKQTQEQIISANFPEFFEFTREFADGTKVEIENIYPNSLGTLTGRYYFDYYGYFWLEVNPIFVPGWNASAWARETTIRFEGREGLQAWIEANRPIPGTNNNYFTALATPKNFAILGAALLGLFIIKK